ncbi:MAG: Crp/Fnr family transcriptional regulator [Rhodospirillales bacterium]|nr:Crp/Fnr family transcriptional regulator [Rhodospirillales bacterium]
MSNQPDPGLVKIVSGHVLLGQLEPDELARVLAFSRTERFSSGQVIFRRGEPGQSMMTVISGRIKISVSSSEGKEAVLAILGRGEVLGEMSLLDGKERSADATAMEAGEALSIHRRDFIPFLERNPAICIRMLGIMSNRLRRTSGMVEDRSFLDLPGRLAKTLIDLGGTDGTETEDGLRVETRMSQRSFGAMLGASRETINKQLKAWQDEGLILTGRGYVVLIDQRRLARNVGLDIGI